MTEESQEKTLPRYLLPVQEYDEPDKFMKEQLKVFWTADEVTVEKDIQDVLVNFTPAEKHGVLTTLKLFTLYELHAGDEYWLGRFRKMFDEPEFHKLAATFGMFELAVHGPFYEKINKLLHLNTQDFYLSYQESPTLAARMKHLAAIIDDPDDLVSLAGFSMIEGAILYSSFAYLKHYQSQGKNKLLNVVRGINFSVRDEHLHSIAGAWCFQHKKANSNLTKEQEIALENKIYNCADLLYKHEYEIIEMIFSEGRIEGITALQLQRFVQSRINTCLKQLGYGPMFEVKDNPIAEWFYKGINDYQFTDFFTGQGREYKRDWDENAFEWNTEGIE